MSDAEGTKKSGYRLEYASTGRAKCKGPKPCSGTAIDKGELRLGTIVEMRGNTSFVYRHWGCVTPKIIENMKKSFEEADELDGFEDLRDEDQKKVQKAWEDGHVADEDIPDSARKPAADEDDEEGDEKPKAKRGAKAKKDEAPKKAVFSLEYAASGRAKCKDCGESIGKGFFRLGHEQDFRGKPSVGWHHWGCVPAKLIVSLQTSYDSASDIPGFSDLKDDSKEKVERALTAGEVPEDDKSVGEAVDTGKKKAAPRRKKKDDDADDEEKPKKVTRARKPAKKVSDDDEEEDDEEEDEPKPAKKRAAPKKAAEKKPAEKKGKAPAKKRASKKKAEEDDESGEDFGDAIAAVEDDEEDEDEAEEEEETTKKRKRAPASKGTSSKPPSKRSKPASSRSKKREEPIEEDEDEYD